MNMKIEINVESEDSAVVASVINNDLDYFIKMAMKGLDGIGANLPAFKAVGRDSIFSCDLRGNGKITIKLFK